MAALNTNNAFLTWGGVALHGYFTDEISYDRSIGIEDISAGAGLAHEQLAGKLKSTNFKFAIIHDRSAIDGIKANLEPGTTATLVWGPDGNTTGRPKHEQSMILEKIETKQTIDKAKQMFTLSFRGADTPTTTLTGTTAGTF